MKSVAMEYVTSFKGRQNPRTIKEVIGKAVKIVNRRANLLNKKQNNRKLKRLMQPIRWSCRISHRISISQYHRRNKLVYQKYNYKSLSFDSIKNLAFLKFFDE